MSIAGDGDSSQPCPSSSSSFTSNLQFFVRTSSRTLSLHASPDETIQSVIFRVSAITRIPMCWLHLHYGKRHLPIDWTLSRCGIENDTTLQLVYCIEIRRICLPWKVVNDLIIIMNDLLAARSQISSGKEAQIYDIIDTLINKFVHMTPIGDNNDTICHLQVFFYSGVHVALCKLYHSPLILHQNVADYVVRLFLKYNLRKLPKFYHVHFVPVLLKFCKLFTRVNGKRDSLYLHCRKTLGFLVDSNGWRVFRKLKRINIITELYPFVVELADQIILSLSSESMPLTITDVAEFSCFLKALRSEIKEVGRPYPIPKEMHVEKWITSLYETFIKLLKKLDESLHKIENFMTQNADMQADSQLRQWANILTVLSDCRKLGKLYEDGSELLNALLLCRRAPLNALIRRAPRNDKYHWLHKHKYVTDFETRRNLVMMLFPESSNAFHEPHEIHIDRSRLLAESFIYIALVDAHKLHRGLFVEFENEEATGYGVLREWFCLVCQAIFSPQNELFLSCPNDRRRFFPNPASSGTPNPNFSFAGRVVALALMHKVQVGITFDRVFFLQLAGKTISLEDIKDADPFLHMSCKKILEMDDEILDSDALGLTFVRETEEQGCRKTIEICHGGKEIAVNSRNRNDFVNLLVQNCFVEALSEQIYQFGQGFNDMFSNRKHGRLFFQGLDLEDFDRILGGSEDSINVEDWKAHTEYRDYGAQDHQISWFWKAVEGMQEQQKRILLCFWTSLRYLPAEGFCGLESKLVICKALDSEKCLPSSQTCFYLLLLPPYSSISVMNYKLQLITQEHMSCTFGLC